jgi:hypothetical protein
MEKNNNEEGGGSIFDLESNLYFGSRRKAPLKHQKIALPDYSGETNRTQ